MSGVIFLDADGVLHPLKVEARNGVMGTDHCFTPSCMQQLVRVVQATGAELVISSSWRMFESTREMLAQGLQQHGLTFRRWTTTAELDGTRASQILAFVSENGLDDRPWVVLDDEDVTNGKESLMMQVVRSRFVKTDGDVGLTEGDADKAIAILQDDEDSS